MRRMGVSEDQVEGQVYCLRLGRNCLLKRLKMKLGILSKLLWGRGQFDCFEITNFSEYRTSNDIQFDQYLGRDWTFVTSTGFRAQWMDLGRTYSHIKWRRNSIYCSYSGKMYGSGSNFDHLCRYWMVCSLIQVDVNK